MRYNFLCLCMMLVPVYAQAGDLDVAIAHVRASCIGISDELNHLKTMAGINTAVTGVGTVAGGVALGTGLAKANVDKQADELFKRLREAAKKQGNISAIPVDGPVSYVDMNVAQLTVTASGDADADKKDKEKLDQLTKKSKTLGNIRTGTLAANTATNVAGTVIAATNMVKGDLQTQIDACMASVDDLSAKYMQARVDNTADSVELSIASKITSECGLWSTVDLSSINNRAKGAAISSGVGAGVGLVGTITSALANSNKVRDDNSDAGMKKEKNLNTASNVLAGGATVASGVATVFNATQINAIKKAAKVADACEGALR